MTEKKENKRVVDAVFTIGFNQKEKKDSQ